jgi:hypothetical protein
VSSPSSPRSEKFRRHNPTVGSDTPTSAAIWLFDAPSAARNTIRARIACCCEADGVLSTERSSASSSSDSTIIAAVRATRPPYAKSLTNYKLIKAQCTSWVIVGTPYIKLRRTASSLAMSGGDIGLRGCVNGLE